MSRGTVLIFWTAVAVAVLLLGAVVSTTRQILAGSAVMDLFALIVSIGGLSIALLVAARIVVVSSRRRRQGP
jgi:hypothetical protein